MAIDDTVIEIVTLLAPHPKGVSRAVITTSVQAALKTLLRTAKCARDLPTDTELRDIGTDLPKKIAALLRAFPRERDYWIFGPLAGEGTIGRIELMEALKKVQANAEALQTWKVRRGAPREDPVKSVCADGAYHLMRNYSSARIFSREGSKFREIAKVLYKFLSGKDADLKRACDSHLKLQRETS